MTNGTATPNSTRTAQLDDFTLASEISRHASCLGRFMSRVETGDYAWATAIDGMEPRFHAEVDEARRRLTSGNTDLPAWLRLFGAVELVN